MSALESDRTRSQNVSLARPPDVQHEQYVRRSEPFPYSSTSRASNGTLSADPVLRPARTQATDRTLHTWNPSTWALAQPKQRVRQ